MSFLLIALEDPFIIYLPRVILRLENKSVFLRPNPMKEMQSCDMLAVAIYYYSFSPTVLI